MIFWTIHNWRRNGDNYFSGAAKVELRWENVTVTAGKGDESKTILSDVTGRVKQGLVTDSNETSTKLHHCWLQFKYDSCRIFIWHKLCRWLYWDVGDDVIKNLSPTFQNCHQYKPSPTYVTNIDVALGSISSLKGSLMAIMGSSGAGKSTLMNILTRRNIQGLKIDGDITVNGVRVKEDISKISGVVSDMISDWVQGQWFGQSDH